ncbi:MAG TPA: NTP transferase domain-containing protein [Candidatus Acidoferrales bacterium]|nr:NTP transferase domain-containing protein [Candidatus Acidoferrales bacterium]
MPRQEKIGIVVQARMRSKRLPGKALTEIAGKPLLLRLCKRLKLSRRADDLVVATSEQPEDDAIAKACCCWGVPVIRGPEQDVATRFLIAARARGLTAVVRVTADNPLTDPDGVDDLIAAFLESKSLAKTGASLVHNAHRRGYPYGTGAEMADSTVLEVCNRELHTPEERENFMAFARQNPLRFRCIKRNAPPERFRPRYFLTVDYPEDVGLHNEIYSHFDGRDDMGLEEILSFLDSNPELPKMNAHLHQPFYE